MAIQKVIVSRETVDHAAQSPQVRRALRARAERMLPRAQRLAAAAGLVNFARSLHIEEGTRPGAKSPRGYKRPYARVIADSADAQDVEHGNQGVTRQSILARSAGA